MSLMLIAHSGVNPLHLTPGKLLSDVPATFGILLHCKAVLTASSKRHELFTAWLVQMLLEGVQYHRIVFGWHKLPSTAPSRGLREHFAEL